MFVERANIDKHESFTVSTKTVTKKVCQLAVSVWNVGFLFLECHHHVSWKMGLVGWVTRDVGKWGFSYVSLGVKSIQVIWQSIPRKRNFI